MRMSATNMMQQQIPQADQKILQAEILEHPMGIDIKDRLIHELWGPRILLEDYKSPDIQCEKYFRYYREQCQLAMHDNGQHIFARTHKDIVDIAWLLRESRTRDEVRIRLMSKLTDSKSQESEDIINNTIDLVVRLLVMIDIGGFKYGVSTARSLNWVTGTLESFLLDRFRPQRTLSHETVKLEKTFTARNLDRIAGIQIVWTSNLADHLQMIDDDTRVVIFHYASFLEYQKTNPLFNGDFIDETLRTLALLFPRYDKNTVSWYKKLLPLFSLDNRAIQCGHLRAEDRQIENFAHWHDRLVVLKQVFDEAEPNNLSQWWYNRKNGVQWYTFWVAVTVLGLTIFFGLIQCIEGALQVWRSW